MRLKIELTTEEAIALRRFTNLHRPLPIEESAALALREYLISAGDLEVVPTIDESSQVEGMA